MSYPVIYTHTYIQPQIIRPPPTHTHTHTIALSLFLRATIKDTLYRNIYNLNFLSLAITWLSQLSLCTLHSFTFNNKKPSLSTNNGISMTYVLGMTRIDKYTAYILGLVVALGHSGKCPTYISWMTHSGNYTTYISGMTHNDKYATYISGWLTVTSCLILCDLHFRQSWIICFWTWTWPLHWTLPECTTSWFRLI